MHSKTCWFSVFALILFNLIFFAVLSFTRHNGDSFKYDPTIQYVPSSDVTLVSSLFLLERHLLHEAEHYLISEINYKAGTPRMNEVIVAIQQSQINNPSMRFALVTNNATLFQDLGPLLSNISYDAWFWPEVLYGTLFQLAKFYRGVKFVSSVDNVYPPINFECNWDDKIAIAISRRHSVEYTGEDVKCEVYMGMGSFDGFAFKEMNPRIHEGMRFSRSYWGAENVASWTLEKFGYKVMNFCPEYSPIHAHKQPRYDFRPRINEDSAQAHTGDLLKYCTFKH